MLTKQDAKPYRTWLSAHCDVYDWSQGLTRTSNHILEFFRQRRGDKKDFHNGRPAYYPQQIVTLNTLFRHHLYRGADTTFVSNTFTKGRRPGILLMLFDIDAEEGQLDAPELAQFVSGAFFDGKCYIEPSRGPLGRHGYFLLDCEFKQPEHIKPILNELLQRMKSETHGHFDSKVCSLLGYPTIWNGDEIAKGGRGNALKLPYLPHYHTDFETLSTLTPVTLSELEGEGRECHGTYGEVSVRLKYLTREESKGDNDTTNVGVGCVDLDRRVQHSRFARSVVLASSLNGWQKKTHLVSKLLIEKNGILPPLDTIITEYLANWFPTKVPGDENRRYSEFVKIIETLSATFRPASGCTNNTPFDSAPYLPLVTQLVPESGLISQRRDKITHQRVADFITAKITDADFAHEFGRVARDITITGFKTLKAKGIVDWTLNRDNYAQLLKIAVKYELLDIIKPHPNHLGWTPPRIAREGMKIVKVKGQARLIAPGTALPLERERFFAALAKYHGDTSVEQVA